MGIVDKITALLPWHGERRVAAGQRVDSGRHAAAEAGIVECATRARGRVRRTG